MEGFKKSVWDYAKDSKLNDIVEKSKKYVDNEGKGLSALSTNETQLLLTRSSRRVVSVWTCSKLCGICFIGGIVVGYTLKRRVRRWASRLLKWIKDD
ncbi:unnamed protein product [Rhodiola kirilowii]